MIKTGIIGLGKMGLSHAAIINAHPDLELVSVCDSSAMIPQVLKKYGSFRIYTDYKRMLRENDLEALFIATPTKFHAEMVIYALEHNLHVFCEKPFSLTLEQRRMMVQLAAEKKLVNQVGYHNRFIATFNFLKDLVANCALGDVYHFVGEAYGPVVVKRKDGTWRSDSSEGGGCLYDYASHVINLVEYVLGNIEDVSGVMLKKIFSSEVEDAVFAGLHMERGISGLLSVNWSDETYRKMSTQLTVLGTHGKIISDAQEMKIFLRYEIKELGLEKGWNLRYITDLAVPVDFYLRGEEYSAQIDYFARHVQAKDTDNINSFAFALHTDKIIELIREKAS